MPEWNGTEEEAEMLDGRDWDRGMVLPSEDQVGGNHYKDMPIQPSEFIYRNGLNWLQGNAIKYICRHARKGGTDDIDKAIHYLELLKEWEYGKAETIPDVPF